MIVRHASIDDATRSWIRNESDERAVANGCFFDPFVGGWAVWWIEKFCNLYEGEWAGQPLHLRSNDDVTAQFPVDRRDWDQAKQTVWDRAAFHCSEFSVGRSIDWQYECIMRLIGWQRISEKWKRPIRRFRQASIWVAKKNKKSPTLAALGLYLFAGDGEAGQKVFFGARDGQQARDIVGAHVVAMYEQSDELRSCITHNKVKCQLTHRPTRSILIPLSSADTRTQESKEGINGSVLIDETHVVDGAFIDRISRAGISRAEPLQVEVSTAGNNPDGYGKGRFDYANDVARGIIVDQELFAAVYAAPQDSTDEQIAADPVRYAHMANPSIGHTVDIEEYYKDYQRSKTRLSDFANFKMYRLNVWQRSANPWLTMDDWYGCKREFVEDDLIGQECWAGLDLSRKRDMSALVLVFKDFIDGVETYSMLPYCWMPKRRAEIMSGKASFLEWAKSGDLRLTPGDTVDYGFIRSEIARLAEKFTIRQILFDPLFAEELTQSIEQGVVGADGQIIQEALQIERVEFSQRPQNFAKAIDDFEALLAEARLLHNGHPVMTWQATHVQVNTDRTRIIKPDNNKDDYRTIDIIVAAVMGLAGAMAGNGMQASYYDRNEVECV